jgi:thioredoxin reductase (NADPH)
LAGVAALVLRDRRSGRTAVRTAAALFVLDTGRPRTAWLAGALALEPGGGAATGASLAAEREAAHAWPLARAPFPLETSLPGVFAAGGARCGGACGVESCLEEGIAAARQAGVYLRGLDAHRERGAR